MKKIEWNKKTKEEKKWFLIKYIGAAVFLLSGLIFGIVALYMNNWNIVEFLKNPTTDLIFLCLIALGIIMLSRKEIK